MGDRGADVDTAATPDEIERMSQLCEEAIRAGAMGFTTSRTFVHRTSRGEQIGTLRASTDEVLGIAAALRRGVLNADEAQRYSRSAANLDAPWELSGLGQLHEAAQLADRLVCFGGP